MCETRTHHANIDKAKELMMAYEHAIVADERLLAASCLRKAADALDEASHAFDSKESAKMQEIYTGQVDF